MSSSGLQEDFCDGPHEHPLFSFDPLALQILDELEVCNPLGTHVKKHKLGVFFSHSEISVRNVPS